MEYNSDGASNSESNPDSGIDIRHETQKWFASLIKYLYASLLIRSSELPDESSAAEKAAALIEQHWALFEEGVAPSLKVMRVVARKL